jgi:hypothetical protein
MFHVLLTPADSFRSAVNFFIIFSRRRSKRSTSGIILAIMASIR